MLPKINYPIIDIELPSTKETKKFRPIIVKEEKILLMAKASESETDIFNAIKQIVNNCSIDDTFDVDSISLYELEYVFLKLRGYSIGNLIQLVYNDKEDNKNYEIEVDLNNVEIIYPSDDPNANIIEIDDKTGIVLKYPPATLYSDEEFLATHGEDIIEELVVRCVDHIYDDKNKYKVDITNSEEKENLKDYLESLDSTTYKKVQDFFKSIPHMEYITEYTNSLGNTKKIVLRTLNDFFMLR